MSPSLLNGHSAGTCLTHSGAMKGVGRTVKISNHGSAETKLGSWVYNPEDKALRTGRSGLSPLRRHLWLSLHSLDKEFAWTFKIMCKNHKTPCSSSFHIHSPAWGPWVASHCLGTKKKFHKGSSSSPMSFAATSSCSHHPTHSPMDCSSRATCLFPNTPCRFTLSTVSSFCKRLPWGSR